MSKKVFAFLGVMALLVALLPSAALAAPKLPDYRPVDMGGVLNVVKGGSTVPLKFEVFAGPTEIGDPAAVDSLTQAKVACDGSAPTDVIEASARAYLNAINRLVQQNGQRMKEIGP